MTKIDKAYLERLGEVLHDEKKAINYKTVSIMMGVHVNIAKQMLYHMHKTAKAEGKNIYATYYVSGMVPRKRLLEIGKKEGEETSEENSSQASFDELEAYLVSICKEKDLEDLKAKYTKIFSIHMYSLSAFPIDNYDVLESLVEFPMRDSEGRTPVDFGPIISSAAQKLLTNGNRSVPTLTKDVPKFKSIEANKPNETKKDEGKAKLANGMQKNNSSSTHDTKEPIAQETKSQKPVKPAAPAAKKDSNRLKSMFATAKPKSETKKVEKVKADTEVQETNKTEKHKVVSFPSRSKDNDSRKRKRIRDVLSSDSEEDAKMSEAEGDSEPESPVPRKRIQIESDSDDDFKESTKKPEDPPSVKGKQNEAPIAPGRKRVLKTVSKSHVDKDGFLVTIKEQVMVSEDEDEEKEKDESVKPNKEALKKLNNESVPIPKSNKATGQPVKSNSSGKNASGKTKQPSLMSFFQKK